MNQQTPEHLSMDAAPGAKPAPAVPHKLKKKLPKGEINPYTKTIKPHEESVRANTKHEPKDGKELEEQQLKGDFIRATSLLGSGPEKQELIAQKALEETTKVSEEELQKRDKQLFQTWIQQNPVQAALLGIDKDDPFEEKKGKSPLKYYKDSPLKRIYGTTPGQGVQHMSRAQAFNYGKQASTNPMATAGVAGAKILQEKMAEWDQERQQYFAKLKAQKDREAKELIEASKPLVQTLDNSAALDESTKQLLAQQWKQGFVENEKKYKNGEIDQYEYALNKAQSLSNAQQYQQAVAGLTEQAQQFGELLKNGQISDGMPEEARDFWTSVASGKGMNIAKTQDGKAVANNGLSIQNVNGQPTMVGWTAGQVEQAQQAYNQLTQTPDPVTGLPKLDKTKTSFEAFLGSVARPGDPTYEQVKQDPMYAQWIDGVNIPVANLASKEGLPGILQKDPALDENLTSYADNIAQQAINNASYPGATNTEALWSQANDYAVEYLNQMIDGMGEQQLRALASDHLNMTPQDVDRIQNSEGGMDQLKRDMIEPLKQAIKLRFETNPQLAKLNQEYRNKQIAMAKQSNAAALRGTGRGKAIDEELAMQNAQNLAQGNYQAFLGTVGKDKITEIEDIGDGRSLVQKLLPTSMGGVDAPAEKTFRVEINGEKTEMPESELRAYIMRAAGIKGSHMGGSETDPLGLDL